MLQKLMAGLVIAMGLVGIALASLVCYFIWPDKDSVMPAWIQAVGSICAILGAAGGIWWQIRHSANQAEAAVQMEVLNLLWALHSELESFETALQQIQFSFSDNPLGAGMVRQIFPDYAPRSAVYMAAAPKIGLVRGGSLRTGLIRIYAELDLFFFTLNRNSRFIERNKNGRVFMGNDGQIADDMGVDLRLRLTHVIDGVAEVKVGLMHAVQDLNGQGSR